MRFLLIVLTIFMSLFAEEKTYGSLKVSKVDTVYDGDTFFASMVGVHPIIGKRIGVRIYGIDTPEMDSDRDCERKLAKEAKLYVIDRMKKAHSIKLMNLRRDKYFRILADVYIDNKNLADDLILKGYAVRYKGGTKKSFTCE